MPTENLPAIRACRLAWNKGRIIDQKRALLPKHVVAIRVRLEIANRIRELAVFKLAIDSKLRGCNLVKLKVSDVFSAGQVKERASITQSGALSREGAGKPAEPMLFAKVGADWPVSSVHAACGA